MRDSHSIIGKEKEKQFNILQWTVTSDRQHAEILLSHVNLFDRKDLRDPKELCITTRDISSLKWLHYTIPSLLLQKSSVQILQFILDPFDHAGHQKVRNNFPSHHSPIPELLSQTTSSESLLSAKALTEISNIHNPL